jgi:hypothetical protein
MKRYAIVIAIVVIEALVVRHEKEGFAGKVDYMAHAA